MPKRPPNPAQSLPKLANWPETRQIKAIFDPQYLNKERRAWCLDFVKVVYESLGLSPEIFARQLGCSGRSVYGWLAREGSLPTGDRLEGLLKLYEANLRDPVAREQFYYDQAS